MKAPAGFDRLVLSLGLAQVTGWGTTYFLPGVLVDQFAAAGGLSRPLVFAGITVMLLVASPISAFAGRFMDRRGALTGLALSYFLLTLGLIVLAQMNGPVGYFAAWSIFGLAMPFGLWGGAQATLVQDRGQAARRPLSYVLMMVSFSQALFWPLTAWLSAMIGWRPTLLVFAALNLAVALVFLFQRNRPRGDHAERSEAMPAVPPLVGRQRTQGVLLTVIALSCIGFVSWGMEIHFIALLMAFGLTETLAISIVALRGPIALVARASDLVLGARMAAVDIAIGACALVLLSQIGALSVGGMNGALLFLVLFIAGTGALSVARATMQLTLFGPQGFASMAGRINQPVTLVNALSPPAFGYMLEWFGATTAFAVAGVVSALGLAALLALRSLSRRRPA